MVTNGDGELVLKSAKATKPNEGKKFNASAPAEIDLTADLFNALMKSTGNNGLLNFNGGKDVTNGQANLLKNTKWTAVRHNSADANSFALTDGTTQKGYADDLGLKDDKKTYRTIDKKNYLQVDTLFNDPASNYVAFVKDTLPYEYDEAKYFVRTSDKENVKKANTRNPLAAEFKAKYYAQRDSIALNANAFPVMASDGGANVDPHYKLIGTNTADDLSGVEEAIAEAKAAANKAALESKVGTLTTAVNAFLAVEENAGRNVDVPFVPESKITDVEAAMFAANGNLTNYLDKLDGLKFVAGTMADGYSALVAKMGGYADAGDNEDTDKETLKTKIADLKLAVEAWAAAYKAGITTEAFANVAFKKVDNAYQIKASEEDEFLKPASTNGVLYVITSTASYDTNDTYAKSITDNVSTLDGNGAAKFQYGFWGVRYRCCVGRCSDNILYCKH